MDEKIIKSFPQDKYVKNSDIVSGKTKLEVLFSLEETKNLRNWILDLQDLYCPPKSYVNSSSRNIVINNPQLGNIPITFSFSSSTFDLVISCGKDFEEAKENVKVFKMEKYIEFYDQEYQYYLENEYLKKSPNSIIFLDFVNSEMKLTVQNLIQLTLFKIKAPLLILLVKSSFEIGNTSETDVIFCKKEVLKNDHYKLIALKPNKSISNEILAYPSVQTLNQFQSIYKNKNLRSNLEKFITNKLRNKGLSNKTLNLLDDLIYEKKDDKYIYNELNNFIFKNGFKLETEIRVDYRIIEITDFIKGYEKKIEGSLNDLLDVGCAEGSITYKVAEIFLKNPSVEHTFGCDVREIKDNNNFQFHLLKDDKLPYEDDKFSIITCLMTLHHIKNVDEMIQEIFRVCKPGSYFLIREHSCKPPEYGLFLDIIHGIYALVLSQPQEWPDFCETYFAKYLKDEEWKTKIEKVGFRLEKTMKPVGNMNWYYSLYQKPLKRKDFE